MLEKNPDIMNLSLVCNCIENACATWLQEFLQLDGLVVLFRNLEELTSQFVGVTGSFNIILQDHLVRAVQGVVNTKVGIKYLLKQKPFTRKLVQGIHCTHFRLNGQLFM